MSSNFIMSSTENLILLSFTFIVFLDVLVNLFVFARINPNSPDAILFSDIQTLIGMETYLDRNFFIIGCDLP